MSNSNGLVPWITERVALSGSKGLSTDELWSLLTLQSSLKDTMGSVDDLWEQLVLQPDLILLKSDPFTSKTMAIDYSNLGSYEEATLNHGRSLYWTATSAQQTHYLFQDKQVTMPPLQRTILEKIGSSGPLGIAQCVIATDLDLKPQTIFHHLKRLQSLEFITKTPSIYQGQYTNTCVHVQYSRSAHPTTANTANTVTTDGSDGPDVSNSQDLDPIGLDGSIRYDNTAKKMNQLLSKASDNMMALSDLIRLTGFTSPKQLKWARNFLAKQHADGYVEKLLATANGKSTMCVKLIKPISISAGKVSQAAPVHTASASMVQSPAEQSGFRQKNTPSITMEDIYAYIASTHEKGCTNKDLYQAFPSTSKSTVINMMKKERTCENPKLITIKELRGRSHVCYYFSKDGFKKYQSINGMADESDPNNRPTEVAAGPAIPPSTKRRLSTSIASMESVQKRQNPGSAPSDNVESSNASIRNVNLTMARRKSALLDIINRDKIRDFNGQLFEEIQSTDGSDTKHKLARKTVQRLVDALEKDGLLRLIKVMPRNLFGGSQPRTLVLSPELDESHQMVKQYLESNTVLSSSGPTNGGTPLKRVDTEVERYGWNPQQADIISRHHYWRYIAKRHGWIDSKWLRAKELHIFMAKSFIHWQTVGDTVEADGQKAISLMALMHAMPIDVFKKVVGIHHHDPVLEAFMETNQAPGMALGDLTDDTKCLLIPNAYQMRRRVQALLSILENLELVRPSNPIQSISTQRSTSSSYTLLPIGIIRNYSKSNRPVLAEKRFTTLNSIIDYWNELQYTCACVYGTETDCGSRGTKKGGDVLSTITLSRTWISGDMITVDQKRHLDQYVDFFLGKVPDNDWSFFLQLSRTTGLLPYRIRSYYVNLGTSFAKRNRLEQQLLNGQRLSDCAADNSNESTSSAASTTGKRKRSLDNTIQDLLQASKETKAVSQVPDHARLCAGGFSTPTFVGSRSLRRKYVKGLDESTSRKQDRPAAAVERTIQPFTPSEKSTFLYAVAVMRHRARQSKFYWGPITQVIPTKSIRQCASRLQSLAALSSPSLRTINSLQQKWAKIYARGMERQEITDERPWDTRNYDLSGYLTYFLSQLLLDDRSPSPIEHTVVLPANACLIQSMHTVSPVVLPTFDSPQDSKQRLDILVPNTMGNTSFGSNTDDTVSISVAKAIQMIKMIMVHPEATFDSHLAYNLLSQCPAESVEKAYSFLKSSGMVVLSKHGDNRRVPGRKFRMSNSFLLALAGPISRELYEHAFDFHRNLCNDQPIPDDPNGGVMASLLNLISQQKITLANETNVQFMEHKSSLSYPNHNRCQDKYIEQWTMKYNNLRIHTEMDASLNPPTSTAATGKPHQSTLAITLPEAERYLQSQDLRSIRYAEYVYTALDSFGVEGATSLDLKLEMESLGVTISDEDLLKTLEVLMNHTPSLVVTVGYNDLRWVCVPHAQQWMMKTSTSLSSQPESYLRMNIWCNLDGETNLDVLHECCSSVVGHILTKPGLAQDELERLYLGSMSKAECQLVLDLLVQYGIIYYRSVNQEPKSSLFSKPSLKTIDPKTTTIPYSSTRYYFTSHDYYYKLCLLNKKDE